MRKKIEMLFLSIVFFGCACGPIHRPSEEDVPFLWHSRLPEGLNVAEADDPDWWESLHDPQLNELMVLAAAQNIDVQMAREKACFDDLDLAEVWRNVSSDVAKNTIQLYGLKLRLQIKKKFIEVQARAIQLTEQLLQRGVANEVEHKNLQVEQSILEADASLIERDIAWTAHRLSVLLGYPPGDLDCFLSCVSLPNLPAESPIGIPSGLLARRPDILKAEKTLAKAPGNAQAIYFYRKTVLNALEEAENAISSLKFQKERLGFLKKAYQSNKNSLEFTKNSYQEGVDNSFMITKAESQVLRSEEQVIQGQVELLLAYVALQKAIYGALGGCS